MHPTTLPDYIVSQVMRRRRTIHPFTSMEATKTAVVVVDMQEAFLTPGSLLEVPVAREIVPNVNRLADEAREAGSLVVWVQMTIKDREDWPVYLGQLVPSEERINDTLSILQPGSHGQKLWREMQADQRRDIFVRKNRFSAFLPSASTLHETLKLQGVDTVVICGTLTNVCCESSARDAAMQNYKVTMVADANAAVTDEAHTATLATHIQSFGDVRTTDEVIRMLKGERVL